MRTALFGKRAVLGVAGVTLAACLAPAGSAQQANSPKATDLDAFMARVLEKRDENWRKLHDYILSETETFSITTSGRLPVWSKDEDGLPLNGFRREYMWYVRDGYLIRSPLKYDGVALSEAQRRAYEDRWMRQEKDREKRAKSAPTPGSKAGGAQARASDAPALKDLVDERGEPRFISEAYFLRFKFEPGHYYLAGRETFDGRQVLKIEYYPTNLFSDEKDEAGRQAGGKAEGTAKTEEREGGKARPKGAAAKPKKPAKQPSEDAEDQEIERDMNKVSQVTLWIEPTEHQIVKYTFDNTDFGFLPARWLVRIDHITASMTMSRVLDGVWLPGRISMQGGITFATGTYGIKYERTFYDYKKAEVGARVRILPPKRP
jgi:hypothetical protein